MSNVLNVIHYTLHDRHIQKPSYYNSLKMTIIIGRFSIWGFHC